MENQRRSNKQYKPINGDFYDELEAASTLNQICEITYQDEYGQEQKVISTIQDLYTEQGVEYAKLEIQIIRLDSIVSLNGKTEGGGKVDTDRLQEDMIPDDTPGYSAQPGQNPLQQHDVLGSPTPGDLHLHQDEKINKEGNVENFAGDVNNTSSVGIAEDRIDNFTTNTNLAKDATAMHQNDSMQDNLLGKVMAEKDKTVTTHHAVIVETVPAQSPQYPVGKDDASDFAHRFITSTDPFLLAENQYYHLIADRLRNRLYLKVLQSWDDISSVPEMGGYLDKIAPLMTAPFTLLNDLTSLSPDENGTLMSPAIPNKDALINAGLTKVADLVPYDCETLVHGIYSFSVNSLRLRYFKDREQAEHWLTGDGHIGGDMKEGRASAYN